MSDMCEHETFRDICGVCHRNTIIEKQEIEITALRAVNDALSEQMMTMIDNAAKVAELRAENGRLREALEWYANPEIYKPHPHGLAFDNRDLSFHARAALEGSK